MMKIKNASLAATAALLGALTLASQTPAFAANGRWAAAGAGFAAGLVGGAIIANRGYGGYYNPYGGYYGGYYYAPPPVVQYEYAPGYRPYRYYGYAYRPYRYYGYGRPYNSKRTFDPDPRIGGSYRASGGD